MLRFILAEETETLHCNTETMLRSTTRRFDGFGGRGLRPASTLAFVETSKEGAILPASLNTLYAAGNLGNQIDAVLVGSKAKEAAAALQKLDVSSLNKILVVPEESLDDLLPERVTPVVYDLLQKGDYSHFVVPASSVGKGFLPRVGALLDLQPICDVTKILDPNTFVRPMYAGNILATVESQQSQKLISIRSSAFPAVGAGSNSAAIETVNASNTVNGTEIPPIKWEGANLVKSERPELGSATRIVSGGRGLKNKETFEALVTPLADTLGAAIGATRAAVDSGFCDNSLQIGQTGKIVAPELYIALGVSGAIQHLAGIKDAKTIVAINKDPEAPIFQVADYGLVGDLNELVPELTEKLKQ